MLIDHLLLHCPVASDVWSFIFALTGIIWVMPKFVLELLVCWHGRFQWHRAARVWMAIPLCLMWSLWIERNKWTFDGIERPVSVLKEHILRTLFAWSSACGVISPMSFLEFLDSLSLWAFCFHCNFYSFSLKWNLLLIKKIKKTYKLHK